MPVVQVKVAKAVAAKERKNTKGERKTVKSVMDEKDEFDLMADDMNKSLTERIGITPEANKKKKAALKQTKLDFKPAAAKGSPKKKAGKNPWSDDEVRISVPA